MPRSLPVRPGRRVALACLVAALWGCAKAGPAPDAPPDDPVIADALNEQLMTDPDLARINPQAALLGGGGPASLPVPPLDRSAETIAAARAEASRLIGAAPAHAPPPARGGPSGAGETAERTARGALAQLGVPTDCAGRIGYTMAWAARLPAAIPVYPRGHAQEAAGSDEGGCRLRVVNFLSPVPLPDMVDFYWARASAAGMVATHRTDGGDEVIAGKKGAAGFVAYIRARDGLTETDLVTNGF